MADKKKREVEKPLHKIRRGQIVATIEQRQSNAGFSYYQFEIGRKWLVKSSQTEKTGTGLFAHQEAEIVEVVTAACAHIRDLANESEESPNGGGEEPDTLLGQPGGQTSRDGSTDA
ncbi:hypothetical protein ACFL5Q_00105 [Planctomycetota bacterium]